jgi:hypothetical protein
VTRKFNHLFKENISWSAELYYGHENIPAKRINILASGVEIEELEGSLGEKPF